MAWYVAMAMAIGLLLSAGALVMWVVLSRSVTGAYEACSIQAQWLGQRQGKVGCGPSSFCGAAPCPMHVQKGHGVVRLWLQGDYNTPGSHTTLTQLQP